MKNGDFCLLTFVLMGMIWPQLNRISGYVAGDNGLVESSGAPNATKPPPIVEKELDVDENIDVE